MSHKFNPAKKDKLDNSWRRTVLPPQRVLMEMKLSSEDDFADIGCGIGYFTIEAAKIIRKGKKVYALDISEEMLEETKSRALKENLKNIEFIQTDEYDLKLESESVSYSLAVNVIHEVDDNIRFLNEIKRILKANGKLIVIDFQKTEMEMGPPLQHRISLEEMSEMLKRVGFDILEIKDFSKVFYGILAVNKIN